MNSDRVKEILKKIKKVNIAVYGDYAIDAYWVLDPGGSEISVETGLKGEAVGRHYYSLGGASNIVANAAALQPEKIQAIGVIGDDIFGHELLRQLNRLNVNTDSLITQKANFDTYTFIKRYLNEREEPRIDFGFYNKRSGASDEKLLGSLKRVLGECDAVIFNQQVPGSITNKIFIEEANKLFRRFNDKIVLLDSRHYAGRFRHVYHKINEKEAAAMNGVVVPDDQIPLKDVKHYAQKVYQKFKKPTIITSGKRGIVIVHGDGIQTVAGIRLSKTLDTVGAGDTIISAAALCMGAGLGVYEAAQFANLAAAVTVQKRFQTGTASGNEILELCRTLDIGTSNVAGRKGK